MLANAIERRIGRIARRGILSRSNSVVDSFESLALKLQIAKSPIKDSPRSIVEKLFSSVSIA